MMDSGKTIFFDEFHGETVGNSWKQLGLVTGLGKKHSVLELLKVIFMVKRCKTISFLPSQLAPPNCFQLFPTGSPWNSSKKKCFVNILQIVCFRARCCKIWQFKTCPTGSVCFQRGPVRPACHPRLFPTVSNVVPVQPACHPRQFPTVSDCFQLSPCRTRMSPPTVSDCFRLFPTLFLSNPHVTPDCFRLFPTLPPPTRTLIFQKTLPAGRVFFLRVFFLSKQESFFDKNKSLFLIKIRVFFFYWNDNSTVSCLNCFL